MQEVVAIMFISLNAAIGILLLTFACAYSKFQTSKGACWILFVVVFYAVTMMLEVTEKKLRRVLKAVISDSNFSAWVKKHKIAVLFADLIADALVFTKSGSVLSAFAMPIVMARAQIAVAAAASRILFHPMLVLSEHVGKCFKLIFSEVPVQWQPFVFIAIFLLVLLFLGIEISGPLMQIGKHGQVKGQLDAERQKNRELKSEIDKLHRRLELTGQNAERAVDYQPGI